MITTHDNYITIQETQPQNRRKTVPLIIDSLLLSLLPLRLVMLRLQNWRRRMTMILYFFVVVDVGGGVGLT